MGIPAKKKTAVDEVIEELRKEYGDRTAARLVDKYTVQIPAISTGVISLDLALGCGGFPRGRISEIFGPESCGKTTIALQAIAQAQRNGEEAVYVDAENALDPEWARKLGVDINRLVTVQPDSGEQALDVVERFIRAGVAICVVDSVEGLVPRAELEGEYGESVLGVKARLMSQACRKQKDIVAKTNTALIYVNQVREKIGVMFGNPTTTPGGRALKFWSSVRVELRRGEAIKEGDLEVGMKTKARVVKNKLAPPHREAEFDVYYGACACHRAGSDPCGELFDLAVSCGVFERAGAWIKYRGEKFCQGRVAATQKLAQDEKMFQAVLKEVLSAARGEGADGE